MKTNPPAITWHQKITIIEIQSLSHHHLDQSDDLHHFIHLQGRRMETASHWSLIKVEAASKGSSQSLPGQPPRWPLMAKLAKMAGQTPR